jgi:hypothetical protein
MLANVVLLRTIAVADAVLYDCSAIISSGVCVEVPSVVGVVPCATAAVGVSTAVVLLVGETVGVASEVGCVDALELIVEVIVRVAVEDKVAMTVLHLDACISVTVNVEILENAVGTDVEESVLASVAYGDTFYIHIVGLNHDAAFAVFLLAEIEDRLFVLVCHDNCAVVLESVFVLDVNGVFQVILTSAAIQSIGA